MMSENATSQQLTLWPGDSPASPSQSQGGARPKKIRGGSGLNSPVLLAIFDHESCSWRMCQESLLPGETMLLQRLPAWGMTRNGQLFQRPPLALPTPASAGTAWPTPTVSDGSYQRDRNGIVRPTLKGAVWATPTARDYRAPGLASELERRMNERAQPLTEQVGGLLNPFWEEQLMGYPEGWTDIDGLPDQENHNTTGKRRARSKRAKSATAQTE